MSRTITLRLPGIPPIPVTAETAACLEHALHEYRRAQTPSRDYAAEISDYLNEHPAASTAEIARGIHARDERVRAALSNSAFERVRNAHNGKGRGTRWTLAPNPRELVPSPGTSNHKGDPSS